MKPAGNLENYDVFNPAGERVGLATRAEVHRFKEEIRHYFQAFHPEP